MTRALYLTVFMVAVCGLVYELVTAAVASYLLGDSVTQFSTVIGTYLFSMGIGSFLSRFIERDELRRFIEIEVLVGVVGGLSAPLLFLAFGYLGALRSVLYPVVAVIGILVGLEIPLLLRILKDRLQFSRLVADVLGWDYVGALAASLLFPLVLLPRLGLVRTSLFFGLLNVAVGLWTLWLFRTFLLRTRDLWIRSVASFVGLALLFAYADSLTLAVEERYFGAPVVLARSSPFQRILVTRENADVRLYLNGHLQFSTQDEYRYHEALVHPGLGSRPWAKRALVLGGGDGMAVREILKYPHVESILLVDLDPEMTALFRDHELLSALNGGALRSPRVTIVNEDAFVWIEACRETFDFAVVDFPDPTSYSLGKLYTTRFYQALRERLHPEGLAVIQSTSPLSARRSFWCVVETVRAAGLRPFPYHAYVPAWGEWGFVIAVPRGFEMPERLPDGLRFLTPATLKTLFEFPPDMGPMAVEVNRLDNQVLVRYYEAEWR